MKPEEKAIFLKLSPLRIMALTIYGEAEGERFAGKLAVGFVIRNRSDLWRKTVSDICLQENQFECFNDGNPRLPKLVKIAQDFERINDDALSASLAAARGVTSDLKSNIGRATFYKTITCRSPWFEKVVKAGTLVKVAEVGNHEFFAETKYASRS